MAWRFNDHTPVYLQIADKLRSSIINGEFPPGGQIPPVRQIAVAAAVNPNTVQRAVSELETEGLLVARSTYGCFVTEDSEAILRVRRDAAYRLVNDFLSFAQEMSIDSDELITLIKEVANGSSGMQEPV